MHRCWWPCEHHRNRLALQLMANFLGHPEGRGCIPRIPNDFLDAFTRWEHAKSLQAIFNQLCSSHLSHTNIKVLDHAVWCLTHCAENEENRRRIRITGAIPLLLSLLENGWGASLNGRCSRRLHLVRNRFFDFTLPSSNTNPRQVGPSAKKQAREDSEVRERARYRTVPLSWPRESSSFDLVCFPSWSIVRHAIGLLHLFGWTIVRLHQWTDNDRTEWYLHSSNVTLSRARRFATTGETRSSSSNLSFTWNIISPLFVFA